MIKHNFIQIQRDVRMCVCILVCRLLLMRMCKIGQVHDVERITSTHMDGSFYLSFFPQTIIIISNALCFVK